MPRKSSPAEECEHPDAYTLWRKGPRPDRKWLSAYDCCEDCGYIAPRTDYRPTGDHPPHTPGQRIA